MQNLGEILRQSGHDLVIKHDEKKAEAIKRRQAEDENKARRKRRRTHFDRQLD